MVDLLGHLRAKERILAKIVKPDVYGEAKIGCHICGKYDLNDNQIHHTTYWSNVIYKNYDSTKKYHETLEKDMIGHESELYVLCRRHHSLIEKFVMMESATVLIFIKAISYFCYNVMDWQYYDFMSKKLRKSKPEIGESFIHTSDFDNWHRIKEIYIKSILGRTGQIYCPICNRFMFDPCMHYE